MKKANMRSKMILQVHDELIFDTTRTEAEELKALIIEVCKLPDIA